MNIDSDNLLGKYRLTEEIYAGDRTLVYRGVTVAEDTECPSVILKLLRQEYPTFNDLLQFRNQYTIAKNLNIAGIVRPLALETYRNSYILVMEDCGGISLRDYTKNQKLSLPEVLEIGQKLASILQEIHHNRIIHKDIKPANIIINPHTKQIKLIDFSIASLLRKETQEIKNPNNLEGTLAYLAPEQTGRMNRGIDYRTDFYSLGITLFELLTGKLPFETQDPMELLHCHLAQKPPNIDSIDPQIPAVVSAIVEKLMAKNAENRYQSALGLKSDLEICLNQLKTTGQIADFILAQRDISDRFIIPEKLYGREKEVEILLESFDRVANGSSEMMLVAGFSGIGKTALVNEVHKPITRQKGYFIKGKFDQFNRNIPFFAFVQALREFMGQLLSESDANLAEWRNKILAALGDNGQVLIEVIPELEKIIGKQPPAPELSGTAAQNRFNLLFPKFIAVFTEQEHPLVVFLDDLQWADFASLQLVKLLMEDRHYLLLLGAYRDNEVSPVHPFMLTVEDLKKAGKNVNTITLNSLDFNDINQLVADTLHCSTQRSHPLTELIDRKTKGNPFFTTQFLKALHEDGQITFNYDQGYWECDLVQINALSLTDNVLEFMAIQLQKLPTETQQILKLAACIGNHFDLNTLAIVCERSAADTADALWKALQEELILPQSEVYKFYVSYDEVEPNTDKIENVAYRFLHDRVQQAAYSLIPDNDKQATHYQIGKLLLDNSSNREKDERLFEIVAHLNAGKTLINQDFERENLAQLNLIAGRKAQESTAYTAAIEFLTTGIELLAIDSWQTQYELTLALYSAATEVTYLSTEFGEVERLAEIVLQQAKTLADRIKIYEIKTQVLISQNKLIEAIALGLQVLNLFGITFPEDPNQSDVITALEKTDLLWNEIEVADLINLPTMTDPDKLAAMQILLNISAVSYIASPTLYLLIVFQQVNLSVKYGNTAASTYAYAAYGLILCGVVGNIALGYEFGQTALNLLQKFNAKELQSKIYVIVNCFIQHWHEHLRTTIAPLENSYFIGLEIGDLEFASYSAFKKSVHLYFAGEEIANVEEDITLFMQGVQKIKRGNTVVYYQVLQQVCSQLMHPRKELKTANENMVLLEMPEETKDVNGICYFHCHKMILCYLLGDRLQAIENAKLAQGYLEAMTALFFMAIFYFYDSLIQLDIYGDATPLDQENILLKVTKNQQQMKLWADNAPMNYLHKFELVEAEKYRVLGNKIEAIDLYDRAIAGAKENGYIQEEGLANELAAKFYLNWGKEKVAAGYMQEAYYCYAKWGAKAKIDHIEKRYSQLLQPILQQEKLNVNPLATLGTVSSISLRTITQSSNGSNTTISNAFDFTSIIKAAQAISSTIQLDELIKQLTQIILQSSGADQCILLFPTDNQWQVRAIATPENTELLSASIDNNPYLPVALIHYVKNTQEIVLIDNLKTTLPVIDNYLRQQQPKSTLCLPFVNQCELVGILYLQNQATAGVFTSNRIFILNFLCIQAAISLQNARLYQQAQTYSQQLEVSLKELQNSQTQLMQSSAFLEAQRESSLDGILVIDNNRNVNAFNHKFAQIWKIPEYIINTKNEKTLLEFVVNQLEEPAQFIALVEYLYQHPEVAALDEIKLKDGRVLERASTAVKLPSGERCGRIWYFRDISDRKAAENAIQQKSQQLEQALQELKQAQLQIVQSEKMSALGNLVAGIAHEINNPVGFISGNLTEAKTSLTDLIQHLNLYLSQATKTEIEVHAEQIDLEYLLSDLPKMLSSMQVGCDQIKNISTSLRVFSRSDKDYKVSFNIHEGIDSTIMILKHRLKANDNRPQIQIIKEYMALPLIECFPGQLNQVFMNILANAIDMFDDMAKNYSFEALTKNPQQITIQTQVLTEANQITIKIKDNGSGMPENVKSRIFEYLFTTKPVGKGTGFGLTIAHQIVVEKHGGSIHCASVPGQGTEFMIQLPIVKNSSLYRSAV